MTLREMVTFLQEEVQRSASSIRSALHFWHLTSLISMLYSQGLPNPTDTLKVLSQGCAGYRWCKVKLCSSGHTGRDLCFQKQHLMLESLELARDQKVKRRMP